MMKIIDILTERYLKYSDFKLEYSDGKTYMTNSYMKIMDYIQENDIRKYKLYGRIYNSETKSSEWELID